MIAYVRVPHGEDALAWAATAVLDIAATSPPMLVSESSEDGDVYAFEIANN